MLEWGMDAVTMKLFLSKNESNKNNILSDFLKLSVYMYKMADSNERSIEASNFVYSIVSPKYSITKSKVVEGSITIGVALLVVVS